MLLVVSVISLDAGGSFLGFFESLVFAVGAILVLDQGRRFGHLLPVAILRNNIICRRYSINTVELYYLKEGIVRDVLQWYGESYGKINKFY